MSVKKIFISANDQLVDSYRLAKLVFQSGLKPDVIVGVWRGGSPIAIALHEFFDFKGCQTKHCAIKASSYLGIGEQQCKVQLSGLDELVGLVSEGQKVLLVDDVFDSGRSYRAIREALETQIKHKNVNLMLACVWFKPENNQTDLQPDFYLKTTADWLVFPHELCGLSEDEIKSGKGEDIAKLI